MKYSFDTKQQVIELYKTVKSTHKVGKTLGIHPGTVYHWIRNIVPDKQRQKNVRTRADRRAISLLKKHGPMTYRETHRFFSDELLKRLIEDDILKRISQKYGKFVYSVYFVVGQEKLAERKLQRVIKNLSVFYPVISPILPHKYTYQEKKIAETFQQHKIPFEHSELLEKINLCPDFCIPSTKEPKIIIEAKDTKTKARGNYTYFSKVMGFDALLIKKHYPNVILVAVINGLWTPSGENRLKQAFDYVILDSNLSELINIIKRHLSG